MLARVCRVDFAGNFWNCGSLVVRDAQFCHSQGGRIVNAAMRLVEPQRSRRFEDSRERSIL
jgi:hypothetical protein